MNFPESIVTLLTPELRVVKEIRTRDAVFYRAEKVQIGSHVTPLFDNALLWISIKKTFDMGSGSEPKEVEKAAFGTDALVASGRTSLHSSP